MVSRRRYDQYTDSGHETRSRTILENLSTIIDSNAIQDIIYTDDDKLQIQMEKKKIAVVFLKKIQTMTRKTLTIMTKNLLGLFLIW